MSYNYYSIVFDHFSLYSRIKSRLRDVPFEMQLIFHVEGSYIKFSPFLCSHIKFIKAIQVKAKIYYKVQVGKVATENVL